MLFNVESILQITIAMKIVSSSNVDIVNKNQQFELQFNMVQLTLAEKIEILRLARNRSTRATATEFNRIHPNRERPLAHCTVARILAQVERTGSVDPQKKIYPHSFSNSRENIEQVKRYFVDHPHASTRDAGHFFRIHHSTVLRILHRMGFFPYKQRVHQEIYDHDMENRLNFCRQLLARIRINGNFLNKIFWTDESPYRINGGFNRQNRR